MKISLFILLLSTLGSTIVQAEQLFSYPAKKPLLTFSAPDGWETKNTEGSLFIVSPDGEAVIVEVMALEAAADDDSAAVLEAKSTVDQDFKNLTLTRNDPIEANGLSMILFGGEGKDRSGEAHINMAIIKHPAAAHKLLFSIIASKEGAQKYGGDCGAMLRSISAVDAAKPLTKEAVAVQTFAYPDKAKPDFTIDFPADWKMKNTDEGAYVESPDKMVAMNVIMIDKAELESAETSLKKSIGERFKEPIKWNKGEEPEVEKDDALGLTTTFHNTVASDGEGTEKYSVNLVSYERKRGDKTLLFLVQNPLRALDKHGDTMQAVLHSIKVR